MQSKHVDDGSCEINAASFSFLFLFLLVVKHEYVLGCKASLLTISEEKDAKKTRCNISFAFVCDTNVLDKLNTLCSAIVAVKLLKCHFCCAIAALQLLL